MYNISILSVLISIPIVRAVIVGLIPNNRWQIQKIVALWFSLIPLPISVVLWIRLDSSVSHFQYVTVFSWLANYSNLNLTIRIDRISAALITLTAFLCPICILVGWNSVRFYIKEYLIAWLVLEALLLAVFLTLDLILFYVFFEATLIPIFLIVRIWRSRERKIRAAYQLFIYTLLRSVLMLLALLILYAQARTTDYMVLLSTAISPRRQILLFIAFFIAFAVKIPIVPVHLWLPEAHVEAPTSRSVILARVILKLGTYGLLRFSFALFPVGCLYFTPLVHMLSLIRIVYASLTTIRQVDLKKAIAYSSVAHISVVTLRLFSRNLARLERAMMLIISHRLVSPRLFLCVRVLYDRYKTRIIRYYRGVSQTIPIFAAIFLFFSISNLALPRTANFVREFLALLRAYQSNTIACFIGCSRIISRAAYSLWLYNRVAFRTLKPVSLNSFADVNRREIAIFIPLILGTVWLRISPRFLLDFVHCPLANLIQQGF